MKLYIKDKMLSAHRNMHVLDENNQPYLYVKGKMFSLTHKRVITDLSKNPLYYTRRKFFHILPKAFIYDENHELIARIHKKFGLHHKFEIIGVNNTLRIEGDIIAWHFTIYENDTEIGTINRHFSFVDSFELDVDTLENAAFLVAIIAAMDNIYDSRS
ncbi:MAG: LURP-one-related family protein [Anaeroplasmataceae bacterium]|nr:LURP-one-related family protein [Anaeroplasmataceae bacterium]